MNGNFLVFLKEWENSKYSFRNSKKEELKMYFKFLLVSLVVFTLFLRCSSNDDCNKKYEFGFGNFACGKGCTGTPSCGKKTCGNVPDMCYCSCADNTGDC